MAIQSDNVPDVFTLSQWDKIGLDQQGRRGAIDDQAQWWNENLFAVGEGNLRSCWGVAPPIYTCPPGRRILRVFFGFYGNDQTLYGQPPPGRKGFMFLDDGTAQEVDLDTGTVVNIGSGPCWQPIAPKYWCDLKVWRPRWFGSQPGEIGGVVFGSPKGLYAWDGTTRYDPGQPAPDWLTSADTDPFPGLTNMPLQADLPGIYALEVYVNRLWVAGKNEISFSKPGNAVDFTVEDGGGFILYFGDKLVHDYVDLAASGGYLFCFGDSSIDVINNVQESGGTQGANAVTSFNYANVDPVVGQRFPRPVGHWGRYFVLYNGAGIYFNQGGDCIPIGQKLSNIYDSLDSSEFYPTMAPATMFNNRVMLFNGMFTDPFGVKRNLLLMWHGTFWSVASQWYQGQQLTLTNIGTYEDNSIMRPFGTDGTRLFELFSQPDPNLPKRLSTKALQGDDPKSRLTIKNLKRLYLDIHDNSGFPTKNNADQYVNTGNPLGVSFTGNVLTEGGVDRPGRQDVAFDLSPGQVHAIRAWPLSCSGISAAVDLISYSPDFTIERLHLSNEGRTFWGA